MWVVGDGGLGLRLGELWIREWGMGAIGWWGSRCGGWGCMGRRMGDKKTSEKEERNEGDRG